MCILITDMTTDFIRRGGWKTKLIVAGNNLKKVFK